MMEVEVFMTDIQCQIDAEHLTKALKLHYPALCANVDLADAAGPFPCGHSMLRVQGVALNREKIRTVVLSLGFKCEILENKVCA